MRQGRMEVQLLRWAETSSGGATITLQLTDADELEPFKLMTLAKGKQAGQILEVEWREVDPDNPEEPLEDAISRRVARAMAGGSEAQVQAGPITGASRTIGPLCLLAVRWCKSPVFQSWLSSAYAAEWEALRDSGTPEEVAKRMVCVLCGIPSRRELDENGDAARDFHAKIRAPFRFIAESIGEDHGDR